MRASTKPRFSSLSGCFAPPSYFPWAVAFFYSVESL